VGSEALSFGSKAAKAALGPELGVERREGEFRGGLEGRRAGRGFGCVLLDLTGK
jgi:hypothetical protein